MFSFPNIQLADIQQHQWSVAALIAVNVLPLAGVMFLGWQAFDIVFLYWLENVVIGVINILKMITCWPDPEAMREQVAKRVPLSNPEAEAQINDLIDKHGATGHFAMQASKLFFVPFFTFHYGLFCLVHGVFVCVLLGGGFGGGGPGNPIDAGLSAFENSGFLLTVIGLVVSHLVSYFTNFLGSGEYRRTAPPLLMIAPYPRIVVLHVAIVLSGFLIFTFGSPLWMLFLLVIGKTLLDLSLHLKEHANLSENSAPKSAT